MIDTKIEGCVLAEGALVYRRCNTPYCDREQFFKEHPPSPAYALTACFVCRAQEVYCTRCALREVSNREAVERAGRNSLHGLLADEIEHVLGRIMDASGVQTMSAEFARRLRERGDGMATDLLSPATARLREDFVRRMDFCRDCVQAAMPEYRTGAERQVRTHYPLVANQRRQEPEGHHEVLCKVSGGDWELRTQTRRVNPKMMVAA